MSMLMPLDTLAGWPTAEDPYMAPQNYDSAPLGIFTRLKLAGGAS